MALFLRGGLLLASCCMAVPAPPRMSAVQQRIWVTKSATAASASQHARAGLLEVLSRDAVLAHVRAHLPELASLTPEGLLHRLQAEMRTLEVTTSFLGSDREFTSQSVFIFCGLPNVSRETQLEFLPNMWTLQFEGWRRCDGRVLARLDMAQQSKFGCEPFGHGTAPPATLRETTDRIGYAAMNLRRMDEAECQYGSVHLVLSRTYLQDMALVAPIDTGMFSNCEAGRRLPFLNCSAWPPPYPLGTLDALDHTLLAHVRLIAGQFSNDTSAAMSHVLERLVAPSRFPMHTGVDVDMFGYLEVGVMGTLLFPSAVRSVIAGSTIFGTEEGHALRRWCQEQGWPLVWAYGAEPLDAKCAWNLTQSGQGHWESFSSWRLLDPLFESLTNASLRSSAASEFDSLWREVGMNHSQGHRRELWSRLAEALGPEASLRQQLAGDCRDVDAMIGVSKDGACVSFGSGAVIAV